MRLNFTLSGASLLAQASPNTITFDFGPMVNRWTLLTLVGTASATKLYVNGGLFQSFGALTLGTSATARVMIGCDQAGSECFNGKIDEVRLYNRALSSSEIAGSAALLASLAQLFPRGPLTKRWRAVAQIS